jgi:hypothetical protein
MYQHLSRLHLLLAAAATEMAKMIFAAAAVHVSLFCSLCIGNWT